MPSARMRSSPMVGWESSYTQVATECRRRRSSRRLRGSGGITTIQGTLTSTANTTFTIELFANQECDPSGFGEGERFLASLTVATSAAGRASFLLILALP